MNNRFPAVVPATAADLAWMDRALGLARQAEHADEVPVGAVVVCAGEVVGEGYNQPVASHDPTAHAEVMALRQAGQRLGNYRLVDCTLYVTLEPCAMCAMAMVHARIGRLVYGAADPRTGAAGSVCNLVQMPAFNHQLSITTGVREADSRALLQGFFRRRRAEQKAARQSVADSGAVSAD